MNKDITASLPFAPAAFLKKHPLTLLYSWIIITYLPIYLWLWERWFARDSYYSHGFLIPFVVGFLIWQKREDLAKTAYVPSAWGLRLIILGLLIHLLSSMFRVYFSSGFSLLIVVVGLTLEIFGSQVFRKIWFPVFFLFFMIPLPLVVISGISFKLKMFAASIATGVLNGMHIPALQEGSIIKMPHTYVIVDDICSGLRSLISLTALGSIFAYLMKASRVKRVCLFLSTIPIAVITNVFRIIFLSLISEIWGSQYATGFTHDLSGFLVFVLAFILLFCIGKLLE